MLARALLLLTLLGLVGCASLRHPDPGISDEQLAEEYDALEPVNRQLFAFNEAIDENVIEPVAEAYRDVIPKVVRDGLRNFLQNLREPVTFANLLLQGRPKDAAETGGRFVLNSTLGLAGIRDVATCSGYDRRRETFGRTLKTWGVGPAGYIVVPLLGPSSPRSLVGSGVDSLAGPGQISSTGAAVLNTVGVIDTRSRLIELVDFIRRAPDYYAIRRRQHLLGFDEDLPGEKPSKDASR